MGSADGGEFERPSVRTVEDWSTSHRRLHHDRGEFMRGMTKMVDQPNRN